MPERNPKVVVVGGIYIDLAVRCSNVPAPGQQLSGSSLSYTVAGGPSHGTVTLNPTTGAFTYAPFQTDRHRAAAADAAPDQLQDSFTVTVSDGSNSTRRLCSGRGRYQSCRRA